MELFLEFLYCLIYVSSMMFCVYKYTDRKLNKVQFIFLLLLYALIDYILTGEITLDINYKFLIDIFVIMSDFIMVCLFHKKFSLYLLFYTTVFYTIYSEVTVITTNTLNYFFQFDILLTYNPSILRFILVLLFNILSIIVFKFLDKNKIIPSKEITKDKYKIFCLINCLVVFVLTIFQWLNITDETNQYTYMLLIIFIFLWLVLLYTLNKSFLLIKKEEEEMVLNLVHQNIEQYMRKYQQDEEKLRKFKHDVKNHFIIIKSLGDKKHIDKYVESIFPDLENINVLSKTLSGNIYIDAIINSKQLEYPNIDINYLFDVHNLKMDSVDLSIILFNLLDNACQAAEKVKGIVNMKMYYNGMQLIIEIKNSCSSKTDFISRRGNGHGYGVNIVRGIVEKYHGNIEFEALDDEVIVKIGIFI